jgi:hypothetical protein
MILLTFSTTNLILVHFFFEKNLDPFSLTVLCISSIFKLYKTNFSWTQFLVGLNFYLDSIFSWTQFLVGLNFY